MLRSRMTNQKGFTLIELMTTVAIIGTLAAVGVPQYRKFQRKARRAEARMLLGAIGSAESAFVAEYSSYGNNLAGIGLDLETRPVTYTVGFTSVNCAAAPQNALPSVVNGLPNYTTTNFTNSTALGTGNAGSPAYIITPASNPATACGASVAPVAATSYTVGAGANLGGVINDQITMDQGRVVNIVQDGTL